MTNTTNQDPVSILDFISDASSIGPNDSITAVFDKVDGSPRIMRFKAAPQPDVLTMTKDQRNQKLTVWDLDKNDYRQINLKGMKYYCVHSQGTEPITRLVRI